MAKELDLMEYPNNDLAQAAYPSSDGPDPAVWDLLDEACNNLDGWTVIENGDASVSVSPPGQYLLDTNTGNYCRVWQDIGETPHLYTFEIKWYHDTIGALADDDYARVRIFHDDQQMLMLFASDGLFVRNTAGAIIEVGSNLVKHGGSAEWQTWRFVVTLDANPANSVCDVYLKDSTHDWVKVGTAVDCSWAAASTDGLVYVNQSGYITNNMISHVDYIKMYTGLRPPTANLQCYSEDTIKEQGSFSLKVIAQQTNSLNDTLTKTLTGGNKIDLTGIDTLKLWVYASREGTHISISIHDSGGTTTTKTITITSAGEWTEITWDISGVADANKDDIDQIQIKITNADAINTFYVDNFYGVEIAAWPTSMLNKNRISGYHCFMDQYLRASREGLTPLKLPDGTVF